MHSGKTPIPSSLRMSIYFYDAPPFVLVQRTRACMLEVESTLACPTPSRPALHCRQNVESDLSL